MRITNYLFDDLPFSKLFKTYINQFDELSDFYEVNPFDKEAIRKKANSFQFSANRDETVAILKEFNAPFDLHETALHNIDRLADEQALAIVTGQQLGVYGGPLYTAFKIISAIHLSRQLEAVLNRPVVPIFWLADEDHDYEEVRSLSVLEGNKIRQYGLSARKGPLPTVAEVEFPDELQRVKEELKESLYDTDFSGDLWALLDRCFQPGKTFLEGFGQWVSSLFSKHGLVLAGSNHPKIKEATSHLLQQSVTEADNIRSELEHQSEEIGNQFHSQVTLYDSNLFYLDENSNRVKVTRNGAGWQAGGVKQWQKKELVAEIKQHPDNFSPNVFLRPILQDGFLPTLGYVAGPGETAYYGQMKEMYTCFDLEMPIIFPRMSATFIEPAIDRIMHELPFEFHEYGNRIEDLESDFVDRTEQLDIETIFEDWKQQVDQISTPHTKEVADIDPTLEGAADKATTIYFNELNKLKGKVYRSVKKQEKTQLKRIRRIKANTFPGNGLQEREVAGIFYMNKYGTDIWDKLLDALHEETQFDHHKLIYL